MKIVVGSLQQESNTLTSRISHYNDFMIYRGSEMLSHIAVTSFFTERGATLLPTMYAQAVPGGPVDQEDFTRLADEFVSMIPREGFDGIWLYLHGALEVQGIGSGEQALLEMIRTKVGFLVPICIALDFHANNTREFLNLATCAVGYRTAPHRDMEETQLRAASVLLRCLREKMAPQLGYVRVPVVVPGDCVLTDEEPLASIMKKAQKLENSPGMVICNVFNGQPWVDAPNMGPSIVCYHEKDHAIAQQAALALAEQFFASRHDFVFSVENYEPDTALKLAYLPGSKRPVFVTDSGDNTTAGAAGDNAYLLSRILKLKLSNVLVGGLTDSKAVELCERAGVGSEVNLMVGGSIEPSSTSCSLEGKVLFISDIEGWYGENAGRCAVLQAQGVTVILTANRCALVRPKIFEKLGLDSNSYRFVVVKLGYLYPELAEVAGHAILALTKGTSTERLQDMNLQRITRPVYPLDDNFLPQWEKPH